MSAGRPSPGKADYVALVLSPMLIIGLVVSLVYFLIEVFYRTGGEWKGRLQWIFFFFVAGAVLVARITMNRDIAGRAKVYGPVLALATYLGMQIYVEYPEAAGLREMSFFINLVLIGIVYWCAYRITWDCTHLDEDAEANAQGLLQAAGLEKGQSEPGALATGAAVPPVADAPGSDGGAKKLTWWERYQRYREQRDKKRTLGVWVVYFSLAALPIFGLGQSLIPLTAPERRQFAFWLILAYCACGLGLLLTTCFLGLRRYLRQRQLQMPAAMTGAWLTGGGGLVLVLLVLGMFLPRPYPEYPIFDIYGAGSAKRKASNYAMKGGAHGEGEGRPGEARPEGKQAGDASGKGGKEAGGKDKGGKASGQGDSQGESGKGESGKSESGKGESNKGESGQGKSGQGEKQAGKDDKQGEKGKDGGKGGGQRDSGEQSKLAKSMKEMEKANEKGDQSSSSSGASRVLSRVSQVMGKIAPVLKWIVFGVIIVVVVFYLLRGGLQFLANFTDWAKRWLEAWRNFWANLFGGRRKRPEAGEGESAEGGEVYREPEEPFSAFPNPFETGAARRWPPQELVRYTFAAVQAWARERDLGRQAGETALEFVRRVGDEVPALEAELLRIADLYGRAAYARGGLPANTAELLRQFWARLERVVAQPLSA
jgi:hypothetical protein